MTLPLLPASFRGVPFGVLDQSTAISRRLAVHEYPGREDIWTEDLGRGATRYRLRGFILENDLVYAGGPIEIQRALLIAAGKAAGVVDPDASHARHPVGLLRIAEHRRGPGRSNLLDGRMVLHRGGRPELPQHLARCWGHIGRGRRRCGRWRLMRCGSSRLPGPAPRAVRPARCRRRPGSGARRSVLLARMRRRLSRLSVALPGNLGRFSRGATSGYLTAIASTTSATLDELVALAAGQRASIAAARRFGERRGRGPDGHDDRGRLY